MFLFVQWGPQTALLPTSIERNRTSLCQRDHNDRYIDRKSQFFTDQDQNNDDDDYSNSPKYNKVPRILS
ncbi:UNVERIFIED_CONTAM: hypothetical protein FKN15_037824 [Acipenser sinensis]